MTTSPFTPIKQALMELQKGRMIILVDSASRENEGDLIIAAEKVTPADINFMITHGRGFVCVPSTGEMLDRCQIPMMTPSRNSSRLQAPFTVSVDATVGITTGVSADDRCLSIQRMVDPQSGPDDFMIPGHIFPLRANDGGVLVREGHTEGSVDLLKLAGLRPIAVLCEIMNEDGSMARLDDLILFARKHNLCLVSVQDVVAAVRKNKDQ